MQSDVVLGVSRRVHGHEAASRAHLNLLAVVQDMEALSGRRVEAPVEGIEQRAVDAGGGIDQACGVRQVAGALLVDIDRGGGKGAGDIADATGVVQVNVRHRDAGQLRRTHPDLLQRSEQHRYRRLAPRLDQHRRRPFDQVAGGHPLPAAEHGVDLEHSRRYGAAAVGRRERHRHWRGRARAGPHRRGGGRGRRGRGCRSWCVAPHDPSPRRSRAAANGDATQALHSPDGVSRERVVHQHTRPVVAPGSKGPGR